jgi:hypothetical protein
MAKERRFGVEVEGYLGNSATIHDLAAALCAAGVRTEVQRYNHTTPRGIWKIVPDGSLHSMANPFELVSPPLKGDEGRETIKKVSAVLVTIGAKVDRTCGFHVHIEANDFDLDAMRRVVAIAVRFERAMDSLVPASRRGNRNRFAESNGRLLGRNRQQALQALAGYSSIDSLARAQGSRYHKLNLESFARYGTVEFRQHSGTISAEKMIPWVMLCMGIVNSAKRSRSVCSGSARASSFNVMMKRVRPEYREALSARRVALAGVESEAN